MADDRINTHQLAGKTYGGHKGRHYQASIRGGFPIDAQAAQPGSYFGVAHVR